MACFSFTLALACGARRKKAISRDLDRLNKETDHHLYLVPACRAKETSREECSMHSQSTQQKESELKPRNSPIPCSEFQSSSRSKLWKVNKIIYLHNQICVPKLYSFLFLLCHTCHVLLVVLFACLSVSLCLKH
ncbi:hypothetical protein ACFX2I_018543 [Malus domestica]